MASQLQREAEDKGQVAECLVEAVAASAAECPAEVEPECQAECLEGCLEVLEAGHKAELEATGVVTNMEIVEETRECGLQVGALSPELQCLELVADMVEAKEVICDSASEIAIDEVEASVPRKKAALEVE